MPPQSSHNASNGLSSTVSAKQDIQSKRVGTSGQLRLQLPAPVVKEKLRAPEKLTIDQESAEVPENRPYADVKESSEGPGGYQNDKSGTVRDKWIDKCKAHWSISNLSKNNLRPVIRSSLSAWIGLLLLLVPQTQRFLGTSSFIILVASFLSPPSDPFMAVLERECVLEVLVAGSYAWSCLGVKLAYLSRQNSNAEALKDDIISGQYIETLPSVICALFLCVGTSFLLFLRAHMGQGKPVIPAMILSCTTLDSALLTAPLYPYPNYDIGKAFVIPIAFHSMIAILCSLFVFPESVHSRFRMRFQAVFDPLIQALRQQPAILETSISSSNEKFKDGVETYNLHVQTAEAALKPLAAINRLMKKDVSFSRFFAGDFKQMYKLTTRLTVRANGMAFYFKIMDPSRHRFTGNTSVNVTPAPSRPSSRAPSLAYSPPATPRCDSTKGLQALGKSHGDSINFRRRRLYNGITHYFQSHHHLPVLFGNSNSLFRDIRARDHDPEHAVGVFESQAYLNLEARFEHSNADILLEQMMSFLGSSTKCLLLKCADTLEYSSSWLQRVNDDRFWKRVIKRRRARQWQDVVEENNDIKLSLESCLQEFLSSRRHEVLDLYRPSLDPDQAMTPGAEPPPHRYLFQCYLFQYHLIHFAKDLIELLGEINRLETSRRQSHLQLPTQPFKKLFSWSKWEQSESHINPEDDEDPDFVSGVDSGGLIALGHISARDPDAITPRSALGRLRRKIYRSLLALGHGNCVFAIKAGLMAAILALPSYLPRTAAMSLQNRFVWAVVLAQTTLSRFRGDTVFGLTSRILSTFFGGIVGTLMWYISTGNGSGNPYALGALSAICYPVFFYARIHYPGPPINVMFFFLTSQLVVGYSWQATHLPAITDAGYGIVVAWVGGCLFMSRCSLVSYPSSRFPQKRFVLVVIGVTVAFLFSMLPPSTTLRRYIRTTYATTTSQLGQLYCDVLSLATVKDNQKTEEIVQNLVAVRMKLNRTQLLRRNVTYELSMDGPWPAERYKKVLDIQLEIAYLLSHLRSVEEHLDHEWAKAFLQRTRFMEAEFQGDVLSVFCMISVALRTGLPLPQITPCPLLDRFVAKRPTADEFGLPRSLNAETLENEQYLYFSVGVATAFGIITRLDRLMLATKELVGEQFQISGVIDMSRRKKVDKTNL